MKKRFWIGFQESWIKAVLVDTDINVTTEEVTAKAKGYGTINFVNPMAGKEIIEEMEAFLKEQGIKDINEIVGII